jgi:hypothetical protein
VRESLFRQRCAYVWRLTGRQELDERILVGNACVGSADIEDRCKPVDDRRVVLSARELIGTVRGRQRDQNP